MAPKLGFGTKFSWGTAEVAKLTNIGGVELSVDMVDITTHQSADAFKEVTPGLIDAGEVSLEGLFDPVDTTGQQAMLTDMLARTSKEAKVTFPGGETWTFSAYVTKLKIGDTPVDGMIPFSASVKPSGKPTFALAPAG